MSEDVVRGLFEFFSSDYFASFLPELGLAALAVMFLFGYKTDRQYLSGICTVAMGVLVFFMVALAEAGWYRSSVIAIAVLVHLIPIAMWAEREIPTSINYARRRKVTLYCQGHSRKLFQENGHLKCPEDREAIFTPMLGRPQPGQLRQQEE